MKKHTFIPRGSFMPLRASADPFAIREGLYISENSRFESGCYTGRGGLSYYDSGVTVGPDSDTRTCVGAAYLEGEFHVAAKDGSGNVDIYVLNESGNSWTRVTASSGAYGDTRLDQPATRVSFSAVNVGNGTLYVAQDGVNAPLYYYGNHIAGYTAFFAGDIEAPEPWQVLLRPKAGVDISGGTNTNGTDIDVSATAGVWRYVTTGAVTAGDSAYMTQTGVSFSSGQVWVVCGSTTEGFNPEWVQGCKFILRLAAGTHEFEGKPYVAFTNVPGIVILAFDSTDLGTATVTGLEIEAVNALSSGLTLDVYALCDAGVVPGGMQYTGSYVKSLVNESRGQALPIEGDLELPGATMPETFRVPNDSALKYQPRIVVTVSPEYTSGVNGANIYRQDAEDDKAYFARGLTTATYSGSWGYAAAFSTGRGTIDDTTAPESKDYTFEAPSAFNQNAIKGISFSAGGRHYIGSLDPSYPSQVWVSDLNQGSRFRGVTQDFGLEEGFVVRMEQGETSRAFVAMSGSVIGSPSVYHFTDSGMYSIGPVSAKIGGVGAAGISAVERDGEVWVATEDNQCTNVRGAILPDSKYKVDTLFAGDLSESSAAYCNGRFYFKTPQGVVVYNRDYRDWESLDFNTSISSGQQVYQLVQDPTASRIFAVSNSGRAYVYDTPGEDEDNGDGYNVRLGTGYVATFSDRKVSARRMDILASGGRAVTTRRKDPAGNSEDGATGAGASTPMWRYDADSETPVGTDDVALRFEVEWLHADGFKFYEGRIELDGHEPGPD